MQLQAAARRAEADMEARLRDACHASRMETGKLLVELEVCNPSLISRPVQVPALS